MLGELNLIVNRTLRDKNKSIVGKLINAKVNFGCSYKIKKKSENLLMNLQRNSINQSLENIREGEST